MSKVFCFPAIAFLFAALVLSFIASISLPFLTALDVVRVDFDPSTVENSMTNLRFGIWTSCYYNEEEDRTCLKNGHAYSVEVATEDGQESVNIGASWTRGLVVQPIATGVTLIAFCLSLSTNLFVMLLSMIASFLAGLMHLISFFIEIALFAYVKNKMGDLDVGATTKPAPGFWLVFASMILCILAAITTFFGRRQDKRRVAPLSTDYETKAAATTDPVDEKPKPKAGFLSRFRKN